MKELQGLLGEPDFTQITSLAFNMHTNELLEIVENTNKGKLLVEINKNTVLNFKIKQKLTDFECLKNKDLARLSDNMYEDFRKYCNLQPFLASRTALKKVIFLNKFNIQGFRINV